MFKLNSPEAEVQTVKTQIGRKRRRKPNREEKEREACCPLCADPKKPGAQWPEGVLLAIVKMLRG